MNPAADLPSLLARYDIAQGLAVVLHDLEQAALQAVARAWAAAGNPAASPYREALLADVSRAYAEAVQDLTVDITLAFNSIPAAEPFVPGVSTPGANPSMETARERSVAVRRAVTDFAASLGLRNRLAITTAATRAGAEAVLAEAELRAAAGEDIELEWRAHPPDAHGPCGWCARLNGTRVRPGEQFPHPEQIGHRQPPRLYLGHLFAPPLHPRCRCRLVIVVTGHPVSQAPVAAVPPGPEDFISSDTIRAMPEEQYGRLHHFLSSATHELGQLLRRLLHG